MKRNSLTAVSLFSGCGGFCEGIELAGYRIATAIEKDHYACETYRFNFPDVPLIEGDIREFLIQERSAQKHLATSNGKVDLVFGGPPCQGYSQIGTRSLEDERNYLYKEFIRILTVLQPNFFLMENVPNVLVLNKGHFKDLILSAFKAAGYANTTYVRVLASQHGVPQERKRVFFIGVHDRYQVPFDLQQFILAQLEEQSQKALVTVWEAISDLPTNVVPSGYTMEYPTSVSSEYQKIMRLDCSYPPYPLLAKMKKGIRHFEGVQLHNHHTKEIQERRLALIQMLAPGKKGNSLPKSVWDGLRPEKWRRLHPDLPAYTLLANMHRDLSEFVHPTLNRWITVREAARLQSFHDGFVFVGSEWQQLKQIGNAVPPLLGKALGNAVVSLHEVIVSKAKPAYASKYAVQAILPFSN